MSTNLHLATPGKKGARCSLFQTPSVETESILSGSGNCERMVRYFAWFDRQSGFGPGQRLDHKLEVATFLVRHPNSEFYGA
jgi:hypothetical protein